MLAKGAPFPMDLLIRSNLVQQELTRLGINSIALLNKTVKVAPDVMRKLRDLLDRVVEGHEHEWMETMQRLSITKITEKRPVAIRSRNVELDCRSINNQLLISMPKDVLLRTSYAERQQTNGTQTAQGFSVKLTSSVTRRVQFTDAREEYEPSSDCSSRDETLSEESSHVCLARMNCLGSPRYNDEGTKFCSGSRETSRINQMAVIETPSARVMSQSLILGKMCQRLPPIPTSRRMRIIPC